MRLANGTEVIVRPYREKDVEDIARLIRGAALQVREISADLCRRK